jgi:hypothetical protein
MALVSGAISKVHMSFGYSTSFKTAGGSVKIGWNPVAQGFLTTTSTVFFLGDLYDKQSLGLTSVEFVSKEKSQILLDKEGLNWKLEMGEHYEIQIYSIEGQKVFFTEGVSGGKALRLKFKDLDINRGFFIVQGQSEKGNWTRRVHNY